MPEGTVKWFDVRKGFGFITTDDDKLLFVHYSNIDRSGRRDLKKGNRVSFELKEGEKGLFASNVKITDEDNSKNPIER